MNRFAFALYFSFIASTLLAGCTAPTFLMNPPESLQPSPEEKMQQTLEALTGNPISKAIQKWAHRMVSVTTMQDRASISGKYPRKCF